MGISVLMVEQNARQALALAHWAYLLETGRVVESGVAAEIAGKDNVKEIFLGGRA
jgi:branched-chain amino acid transport system ATP-binding protein